MNGLSCFFILQYFNMFFPVLSSEYKLYQHHVTHSSANNAKQCVSFPQMKDHHCCHCNSFWNAMRCLYKTHTFQTIHYQHRHDSIWKYFSKVCNKCRGLLIISKDYKWKKSKCNGHKTDYCNQNCCICIIHCRFLPLYLFLYSQNPVHFLQFLFFYVPAPKIQ